VSRYRLTGAAEADLAGIFWQGLERFGAVQTERYLTDLEAQFDLIADFPEIARLRGELINPVRAHPHSAHIIIYEIEPAGIAILRIRAAAENWAMIPLGEDEP
jgi:toxin ParE1/3/4